MVTTGKGDQSLADGLLKTEVDHQPSLHSFIILMCARSGDIGSWHRTETVELYQLNKLHSEWKLARSVQWLVVA